MTPPLVQHLVEIEKNRTQWDRKPLLRKLYKEFYDLILPWIQPALPGLLVEVGSGRGNLKSYLPQALSTDLFPNPWLDLTCDAYEFPFADQSLSHLILFDVFHHLQRPVAFLEEARRVLQTDGRIILLDPYISFFSWPIYCLLHHEAVAWSDVIESQTEALPRPRPYYSAQGNATRLFF